MRKTEIVLLGLLLLFYVNKILGLAHIPIFVLLNLVIFLIIAIGGFRLYKATEYKNKINATLLAVYCGLAFAFGLLSFQAKIWNHSNIVVLVLGSLNFILFPILIIQLVRSKKANAPVRTRYFKGLLIRSSVLLFLSLTILFVPFYILNLYLNKDVPELQNRGFGRDYYNTSMALSSQEKYEEGLSYAQKSMAAYRIGYGNDSTDYDYVYEAFYNAYWGLILQNVKEGKDDKALEYIRLIQQPMKLWYGDSTTQEATIKTVAGEIYQRKEKYEIADSLFGDALQLYKNYYKTKNLYYTSTLQLLAKSFREQHYYNHSIRLYKAVVDIMENDTTIYTSSTDKEKAGNMVKNTIASANAEIGWLYSLKQLYDSADFFFDKAFEIKTFAQYNSYPKLRAKYAYHTLFKGDFHKAKTLMEEALKIQSDASGEKDYDYLYVLEGLNKVNTDLANYKEAEQGCNKAIEILKKMTPEKDSYYASMILQLAYVKHEQGFYDDAEKLYNEALIHSDPKSLQYADIQKALSGLKSDLSYYPEALELAEGATKTAEDYFEKNDSHFLTKYFRNEAYVNYLVGNTDNAQKIYLNCFSIDTANKMQDKIGYGATLNGLGLVKTRQKKYAEADTLFDAVLKIYEKKIGLNHPDYATVLYNKACLKADSGDLAKSEMLFNQSMQIIIKTLDSKHDKVADDLVGLGEIRLKQKRMPEALDYFSRALEIYKAKFKADHKKVIEAAKYVAMCKGK